MFKTNVYYSAFALLDFKMNGTRDGMNFAHLT